MAKCRKKICSKNIQSGAKVPAHLMFNMLLPSSSGFCATLYIRFGIQSGARGMSAYFCVVWDFQDTWLFPLQEEPQNFYTLKIVKHVNEDKKDVRDFAAFKKWHVRKIFMRTNTLLLYLWNLGLDTIGILLPSKDTTILVKKYDNKLLEKLKVLPIIYCLIFWLMLLCL